MPKQHPLERRYKRLAKSNNRKAERLGRPGRISHATLFSVYEESGGHCAYCGVGITAAGCSFDHVVPFDRGGDNVRENIVACCTVCQRAKFTKTPEEYEAFQGLSLICLTCGFSFRPRWADYQRGLGRYCKRACSGAAGGKA